MSIRPQHFHLGAACALAIAAVTGAMLGQPSVAMFLALGSTVAAVHWKYARAVRDR